MELKEDFFETEKGSLALPFPAEDYDKKGKLKKIRGRVLKKLLKYEWKHLLPIMLLAIGIVLAVAVLLSLQIVAIQETGTTSIPFLTVSILVYVYGSIAVLVLPFGLAEKRLRKNFFKSEAALTFSIPASAEEHLLAKHLSAFLISLLAFAGNLLGILILGLSAGDLLIYAFGEFFAELADLYAKFFIENPGQAVLFTVEGVVFLLELCVGIPCVCGALTFFLRKYSDKKMPFAAFVVALVVIAAFSFLQSFIITSGVLQWFVQTQVRLHFLIWIFLCVNAAIIVLCLFYEIRVLKYKLNI